MPSGLSYPDFESLFARYGQPLTVIAHSYVRDVDAARDIVHDAFLSLWERRGTDIDNIPAYLYSIVRNLSLRHRRDTAIHAAAYERILKKEQGLMDWYTRSIESCRPEALFTEEIMTLCRQTLAELPERTRSVFYLSRMQGLSYKEIAAALGLSVKQVDHHLQAAARALRESLKDYL